MSTLQNRYHSVQERISAACLRGGRSIDDVNLIWVSKTHPRSAVDEALTLGARDFGESKVQEAQEKFLDFVTFGSKPNDLVVSQNPSPIHLHMIGRLQSNKVRKILPLSYAIHSVDSVELLMRIDRLATELHLDPLLFLECNLWGEATKAGHSIDAWKSALQTIPPLSKGRIYGLMTMAPYEASEKELRKGFATLRVEGEKLSPLFVQNGLMHASTSALRLSMGMSRDFEFAIEEGSHYIRVGTDLFGER